MVNILIESAAESLINAVWKQKEPSWVEDYYKLLNIVNTPYH